MSDDLGTSQLWQCIWFGGTNTKSDLVLELITILILMCRHICILLPVSRQLEIFSNIVEPTLAKFGCPAMKAGKAIGKTIFGLLANAALPGLGTLSKITGVTGYLAERTMDLSFSHELGMALGLEKEMQGTNNSGEGVVKTALAMGKTPAEILLAYNTAIRAQGGDMSTWDEIWNSINGDSAANASTSAANTQAGYQQQALNYLKQREAIPSQMGGEAIQRLGGVYGLPGGVGTQQGLINSAQQSPYYKSMMSGLHSGEQSILRNAGATGGLRSGNVNENLYDYNVQLQNQALSGAYNQQLGGLQTLAGYNPAANANVAQSYSNMGSSLAQGQVASQQAQQDGMGNMLGLAGSIYQGLGGYQGIKDIGTDLYDGIASLF